MKKYFWFLLFSLVGQSALAFELIAHRGVHQTYHRKGINDVLCTATRIDDTGHRYLENTLESIVRAFELGATVVEIDIHPTTEAEGPDNMVVFHDWTLNCRTNATKESCKANEQGECVTHDQSLAFLKSLDLGHGYTFDKGKTYPFRGQYFGKMPTLEEVLDLLNVYKDKKILINQKDRLNRTVETFLRIVGPYPEELRSRLYFPRYMGFDEELERLAIPETIYQAKKLKTCMKKQLISGLVGHFPKECRDLRFFIPIRETLGRWIDGLDGVKVTTLLWGWPTDFIERAHSHGSEVYASQVDSEKAFHEMMRLNLKGIMTNKIELIAPLYYKEQRVKAAQTFGQ